MPEIVRSSRRVPAFEYLRERDRLPKMFLEQLHREDYRHRTVIDVGTGTGRVVWEIAPRAHRVIGVDREERSLREARAYVGVRAARVRLVASGGARGGMLLPRATDPAHDVDGTRGKASAGSAASSSSSGTPRPRRGARGAASPSTSSRRTYASPRRSSSARPATSAPAGRSSSARSTRTTGRRTGGDRTTRSARTSCGTSSSRTGSSTSSSGST